MAARQGRAADRTAAVGVRAALGPRREPSVRSRRRRSSHGVDCAGAGDGSCHSGCRDCNRRTAVDALAIAGTAGLLEPVKARENAREHITAAAERGARERARQ